MFGEQFVLMHSFQASSPSPELSTPSNSTAKQTIRLLYGQSIGRELLHVSFPDNKKSNTDDENGEEMDVDEEDLPKESETKWKGEAFFTSTNYHAKKTVFLLFINRM